MAVTISPLCLWKVSVVKANGGGKADKEGKCGEGNGGGKADKEGKCGEGKCGGGKADKEVNAAKANVVA